MKTVLALTLLCGMALFLVVHRIWREGLLRSERQGDSRRKLSLTRFRPKFQNVRRLLPGVFPFRRGFFAFQ